MRLRPTLLAAALLAACSASPTSTAGPAVRLPALDKLPTGDQTADQATLDSARAAIRTLAGTGACSDGRCASVAVGVKPCGGPWEYVRYCPTSPDAERVRAMAGEVARANRAFNERYGIASSCDVTLPPDGCPVVE